MAHKVLADRIAKRDPGNKPSVGSRIPFIYFQTKRRSKKIKMLQGERVEDPSEIIPSIKRAQEVMNTGKPVLLEFMTKEENRLCRG